MPIRVTIQTEPTAKGRPRTVVRNGVIRTYTPEKTQIAQDFVKARLKKHTPGGFPAHIPVRLSATFYRARPKWIPRREALPVRKPDLDNFLKLLLDSLDEVLVPDDAQITTISVRKRWSTKPTGYVTIKLEPDNGGGDGQEAGN